MEEKFNLIKQHADTAIIIGSVLAAALWMNSSTNAIKVEMGELRTDLSIIKTVLIMKGIMPPDLGMTK